MSSQQAGTTSTPETVTEPEAPNSSISEPTANLPKADSTQPSTSASEGEENIKPEGYYARPRLGPRKDSGTMIVPADHPEIEIKHETYPPNDARAMSPKRSSAENAQLIGATRLAIESHANELQSGLNALVEKVESIKSNHEKLEKNNNALQDYIGGLTRSMSRNSFETGRKK